MIREIKFAAVELTRRCNMSCAHCMRGDPQDVDVTGESIQSFFSQIRYIDTLVLSGGEPSLAPEQIKLVHDSLNLFNVGVYQVEVVTNGKMISDDFIEALQLFREPCRLNLAWGGKFHEDVPEQSINKIKAGLGRQWNVFPNGHARGLIKQGRSQQGELLNLYTKYHIRDGEILNRPIYLNAHGMVMPHTDMSYVVQDYYPLCSASDDILEAAKNW